MYVRTAAVFCGVTDDGLALVTEIRPLRTWSTERCSLRMGGNTAAAVLQEEEEENHRPLA